MSTPGTFEILGFEIKTPKEWMFDKLKENLTDTFIEYLAVSPIVIGVSVAVYFLVGMFSKTLAKISVGGVVLYSGVVFLSA